MNALAPMPNGRKIAATEFVAELGDHDFNLLAWARNLLAQGKAEDATSTLRRIRGVDWKIAAFYLRDVARSAGFAEADCGPLWCFQPADIWVRRTADVWGRRSGRPIRDDYWKAAHLFADLAIAAGVRGGDLNAGAWILGSQFSVGREMGEIVGDEAALRECLRASGKWISAASAIVGSLEEPSRERIAHHEAGHAVALVLSSSGPGALSFVTIATNVAEKGRTDWRNPLDAYPDSAPPDADTARKVVTILFAGQVAERHFLCLKGNEVPPFHLGWRNDNSEATRFIKRHLEDSAWAQAEATLRAEAARLVCDHWSEISRVAGLLLERTKIWEADVRAVLFPDEAAAFEEKVRRALGRERP